MKDYKIPRRMKGVKVFSLFTLLYMILVITANARPAALGNTSVTKCQIDEDCSDGEFCYKTRQCATCRNCAKLGRVGPRDGNCARSKDECGPCIAGYKDRGSFCVSTTTELSRPKLYNSTPTADNKESQSSPSQTWMVSLVVCAAVFALIIVAAICSVILVKRRDSNSGRIITKRGLSERAKRKDSEREGLTSPSTHNDGSADGYGASAPIEEEYHQPPYNYNLSMGHHSLLPNNARSQMPIVESRKQKALPFNPGNGSGEWAIRPVVPFGNHPNNFGNQGNVVDNQEPFIEQPEDLQIGDNLPDGAIVPPAEEGLVHEEGAIHGPNEVGAGNDNLNENGNVNEGVPQQPPQDQEGILFQVNLRVRAFFNRFTNEYRPERSTNVGSTQAWASNLQMDVMNPITDSNTSLDSGISSSAGEAALVPSLETSFVQAQAVPYNDMPMEEDV